MNKIIFLISILFLFGCKKDYEIQLDENNLADYIELNKELQLDDIIACAAGKESGLDGLGVFPTSVFFLPTLDAFDFRYFEAENIADSLNFEAYVRKDLTRTPVFNGFLQKFNNPDFTGERMAIVTYKTPGKLHVCTPIRQKTNLKPTEINSSLLTIESNGVEPTFSWNDGEIDENVIYFQVVSKTNGDLISGTYTYEKNFTFYDLSNVVLNINDIDPAPELVLGNTYHFTMMAVSEDNWVNLLIEDDFVAE